MREPIVSAASEDSDSEVNLTPMLDVVFIMLIFFIVTASFVKEVGIDINSPDDARDDTEDSPNILIEIDANSEIFIATRSIDFRAVRANIERLRAESPNATVVIRPHKKSKNKRLVQVLDASRQAGVYDVALAKSDESG